MKTKKALSVIASVVFLGGLAFAFGSNESFTGNLSGVIGGQSAKEILSSEPAFKSARNVMNLLTDGAIKSAVSDKLDDDRYTGVIEMTREDAEDELELLQGYIADFTVNQTAMEAEVQLESPDLSVIEYALAANEALFDSMDVQYRFLGDYRDYQNELTASAALMYQAFAEIAADNEAEYEELLDEQDEVRESLFTALESRGAIIDDIAYLNSAEVGSEGWDPWRTFALNDFGRTTIPELYDHDHGHGGPFNFPSFYEGFRENLAAEKADDLSCINETYGSLEAPFTDGVGTMIYCLNGLYLNAIYMDYPYVYDSANPSLELSEEILVLQDALLDVRNFSQLDSVLNDYFDLFRDASEVLSDDYEQLFVDYLDDAADEIASIDSRVSLYLTQLGDIADRLAVLQARATAISEEGQDSLDMLLATSEEAQENFEWIASELNSVDVSAFVSINSLYLDEYNRLTALEAEADDFSFGEEEETEEETLEEEEIEEESLEDEEVEEETALEEELPEEHELNYEDLARSIVEDYGVDYKNVEDDLKELLEASMSEDEFRSEVERITKAYIASTETDGYLLSLDQVKYIEDLDTFMVNYTAIWLGSGMSGVENVSMQVLWNDSEETEFNVSVGTSGDGQLYEIKEMKDRLPYEEEALNSYVFSLSGSSLTYEIDNTPELELSREEELYILLDENFDISEEIQLNYEDALHSFVMDSVAAELSDAEFLKEAKNFFASIEAGEIEKDEAAVDPFDETVEVDTLDGDTADVDAEMIEEIESAIEALEEDVTDEEETEEIEEVNSELEALQVELEEAIAAAESAANSAANAANAAQSAANTAASNSSSSSSQQQEVNVVIQNTSSAVDTSTESSSTLTQDTGSESTTSSSSSAEVAQDPDSPFTDVSEGTWYGDAIVSLYDEGIMEGNEKGEAEPWKNGNRAELIVMIIRAFYSESELAQMNFEHQFEDVPETAWYNMHVSAAVEFNILDEKAMFYPSRNMTRAEFITSFIRAANRACVRCDADFTDVSQGDWYYRALATAVSADLIAGFEDGTFRPDDEINRAQVAAILEKALEIGWVR